MKQSDHEMLERASHAISRCKSCSGDNYCDRHELVGALRDRLFQLEPVEHEFEELKAEIERKK